MCLLGQCQWTPFQMAARGMGVGNLTPVLMSSVLNLSPPSLAHIHIFKVLVFLYFYRNRNLKKGQGLGCT